jgi:hypothetical protein
LHLVTFRGAQSELRQGKDEVPRNISGLALL